MKILKILETVKNFIKKNKKLVTVVSAMFCAVVLVAGSIAGTIAYLTSTAQVTNTFTVGNIKITMDETKVDLYGDAVTPAARTDSNEYKLIPGHEYKKDPVITVEANSEKCYLFVKVENGISAIEDNSNKIAKQITTDNGWTQLEEGVYYKVVNTSASDQEFTVFSTFKLAGTANVDSYKDATIDITAYAIQFDGFTDAAAAWSAGNAGSANGGW